MIEKEVEILSGAITLAGTLCLPDIGDAFPTVLMVHGSGPLDRDENFKKLRLNVFNTLAHHLCEAGIASLRYDKRGCGRSTGDYYRAGHRDLVDDAIACFDALRHTGACREDEIYVLGHSEGTIIAPQVAVARSSVAGLILLNPFAQSMETVMANQARHFADAIQKRHGLATGIVKLLVRMRGGAAKIQQRLLQKVQATDADTIRFNLGKLPAKWLREMLALDPEQIYRSVTAPMLVLGGEKDVQCDPADVARIAKLVRGPADATIIKDLTHILRRDPGVASIFHYRQILKKPVDPEVLTLVCDWLKSRTQEAG